jgi:hypothetical protein
MVRRAGRRGNATLELALVMIPWMALFFAIIDFGFAVFVRNSFQHAVREGVRYAVTFQTMSGMGHDASIKSVVQANSFGFLSGASGADHIHIRYYLPDTLEETANNYPGYLIEVSIENYQWSWIAPFFRTDAPLTVTARSMDRMEGLPAGTSVPVR